MKILLLHNSTKLWNSWDRKIQQLKDWWLPEIQLDITLERSKLRNIPWVDYVNSDGKTYKGIEGIWFDKNVAQPAKDRGFECVMFTVDSKDWPDKRVQGWHTGPNIGISEIQIYGKENAEYNFNGVQYEGGQWFNIARHEISHALYTHKGIADNTHLWWTLSKLENVKKDLFMPRVTLIRTKTTKNETIGELTAFNGLATFSCKTLELAYKGNKKDISCIPPGTYKAKWTFSPRFMKYTYEILNVPNRSGIRIHVANYFSQLNGCIALGNSLVDINKDGELDTVNSKVTIDLFNNFMQKKEFDIIII